MRLEVRIRAAAIPISSLTVRFGAWKQENSNEISQCVTAVERHPDGG